MSSGSGGGDTESIEVAGRIFCCKVGEGPFPAKNQNAIHCLRFNDFFLNAEFHSSDLTIFFSTFVEITVRNEVPCFQILTRYPKLHKQRT